MTIKFWRLFFIAVVGLIPLTLTAQYPSYMRAKGLTVMLEAQVQDAPPQISLSWQDSEWFNASAGKTERISDYATSHTVFRRLDGETVWGEPIATLPGTATGYVDTQVAVGVRYEYRVDREAGRPIDDSPPGHAPPVGAGMIVSGIKIPLAEFRGRAILVADTTYAAQVPEGLQRLERDLAGDGWQVVRLDIAPTADPQLLRAAIRQEYAKAPHETGALILFGRIPIARSGWGNPDGHGGRQMPADGYYADMAGVWTDSTIDQYANGAWHNRPGDGRFDQNNFPGGVDLMVGRVTLNGQGAHAASEAELLQRYLDKNHAFRHAVFVPSPRVLVDDVNPDPVFFNIRAARAAWRLAPLVGHGNVELAKWRPTLRDSPEVYLWAFGNGAGTYINCTGITSSSQLAADNPKVVFTMLFGSYFWDWTRDAWGDNNAGNLLRSVLATHDYALTSFWTGWGGPLYHHHMAMGDPIGKSIRVAHNDAFSGVHYSLMGDPTLRISMVAPVSNVQVAAVRSGEVDLLWNASPDPAVIGYHVYRGAGPRAPFARVNAELLDATAFTDVAVPPGEHDYMVRAVKLETSPSGSYYNASQGVFASATVLGDLGVDATIRLQEAPATYADQVLADAPVGYWRLGETSGTSAADTSGYGQTGVFYNGTAANSTAGVTLGAAGIAGDPGDTAVVFNGTSGRLVIPHHASFDFGGGFTLEAWIKFSSLSGTADKVILGRGTVSSRNPWRLRIVGQGTEASPYRYNFNIYYNNAWRNVYGTVDTHAHAGEWVHLEAVLNTATGHQRMYVNGLQTESITVPVAGVLDQNTSEVSIASEGGNLRWFQGAIDEVAIYNTPLDGLRIQAHYQAGLPIAAPEMLGVNIFNDTGEGQTAVQTALRGEPASAVVRLENRGGQADAFRVTAPPAPAGWDIRYYALPGGADLTAQIGGAGWTTPAVAPGGAVELRMDVTPTVALPRDAQHTAPITAASVADAGFSDTVALRVAVEHDRPDLMIATYSANTGVLGKHIGHGEFGVDGSQFSATTNPADTPVTFMVLLQNAGNRPGRYTLTAPAPPPGWSATYSQAGVDITAGITGGGWSSKELQPLSHEEPIRVTVTGNESTAGQTFDILMLATAHSDVSAQDAVRLSSATPGNMPPDFSIRLTGQDQWIGVNQYDTEGLQKALAHAANGEKAVFELRVTNHNAEANWAFVYGPPGANGWIVKYFDALSGGNDITVSVTIGESWNPYGYVVTLDPHGSVYMRLEVTAPAGAGQAQFDVSMKLYNYFTTEVFDTVRATTFTGGPVAANPAIDGEPRVGGPLTGTYTFTGGSSNLSAFRWLRADTADGEYTVIEGATGATYTPTPADSGKFIVFEVTPIDENGPGAPVTSAPAGPVYVSGDFSGDGVLSGLDIPGFKQALADPDGWAAANPGRPHPNALGDFNGDGVFSGLDIPGFKQALAGQ